MVYKRVSTNVIKRLFPNDGTKDGPSFQKYPEMVFNDGVL
jgi:hypothetical protein